MMQNFKYFIVFTSAPGVLPEQNDWYRIQPWKVNEIKAYKNNWKQEQKWFYENFKFMNICQKVYKKKYTKNSCKL